MRKFRRGQMEIQFHWVFALVGGLLFLLFFFVLIKSVLKADDEQSTRELAFSVQTIIGSSPASPETFKVYAINDGVYTFDCARDSSKEITESYVQIDGKSYEPLSLRYVPLFSPRTIEGDELFVASRTWKAPFHIGSLVLASNNRTRYVYVVQDNMQATKLRTILQEENMVGFGNEVIVTSNPLSFEERGFSNYRFIFFNTGFIDPPAAFKEPQHSAVVVSTTDNGESGTMIFVDALDNPTTRSPAQGFYGRAMLFAGIFAQDYGSYTCNMAKAAERLETNKRILQRRLNVLRADDRTKSIPVCGPLYGSAEALLTNYPSPVEAPDDFRIQILPGGNIAGLAGLNRQLIAKGCPSVY